MFSNDNRTQETILVVLVTLAILSLIVGLALVWVNHSSDKNQETSQVNKPKTLSKKKRKVLSNYRSEIETQLNQLQKFKTTQKLVADTQQFFLNAQVPKKFLDPHFQAFLEFKNKKEEIANKTSTKSSQQIKQIITSITN